MSVMKFTEDHEWLRIDADGTATVGITDHAQQQLGDLVHVELPEVGQEIESGSDVAVIESVKAAGEVKAPLNGTVVAVNESLVDEPAKVNSDATGDGWFFKMKLSNPGDADSFMDEAAYSKFIED
jgi:glycine cleavage system H protein